MPDDFGRMRDWDWPGGPLTVEEELVALRQGNSRDGERRVRGFMCGVDWQHELGAADDGTRVYPSEGSLRDHLKCADECGVVEVEVRFVRWVQEQNL